MGLCSSEASLLNCGDCGWQIPVFQLVSSQKTQRTYFENESATFSGFYHACAISEHPLESWYLERDGWAQPSIHSINIYQLRDVINDDDSVATKKYANFSLNQVFFFFFFLIVGSKED